MAPFGPLELPGRKADRIPVVLVVLVLGVVLVSSGVAIQKSLSIFENHESCPKLSVCTGAKRRHGGRAAADFFELGLESLIKSEDCIRFENADRIPEWLREKNTKPQRTSTADCTQKSLRLSGMPLISAGAGLLLGAIGTAEHQR